MTVGMNPRSMFQTVNRGLNRITTSPTHRIRQMRIAQEAEIAKRRDEQEKAARLMQELLDIYQEESEQESLPSENS